MSTKIPVVALVGRTNVGKSTLFNRLAGKNIAVVEDLPGVTRDRNYALAARFEKPFFVVDTGGLAGEQDPRLTDEVLKQTESAIKEADLIVCMYDGISGLHPDDRIVTRIVRASKKPVIWVANKCEKPGVEIEANELYQLGIEDLIFISAEHNRGVKQLVLAIEDKIEKTVVNEEQPIEDDSIKVAIIGKPNVGKSTLINRILNQERVVTSDIAGTTRDSVYIDLVREGQKYTIIDTAGLRKKAKVSEESLEYAFNTKTLSALVESDVVVLMIDATAGAPSEQDTKIAGLAHERGRPLVIVINKWDLVEKDHRTVKEYSDLVYDTLKFVHYAPIIFISALSGRRCPSVLEKAKNVYDAAQLKIKTSDLNNILSKAFEMKQAPAYRGQILKMLYATQINVAPPTFLLFMNFPKKVNFSYERYLKNCLRKHFPFEGSDIRLVYRKRSNNDVKKARSNDD
jgi:GTP-binding protein